MAVRAARRDDVPTILVLIRGLAEYEHALDAVAATEADLARDLFGARPYAEVLLAEDDGGAVVGFALFLHTYSTWLGRPSIWIEDLFVLPEHRGGGHGFALLRRIAELAVERHCGRVEWSVLDWNATAIAFYERIGATAQDEWTIYRLTGSAIPALASGTSTSR